MSTLQKFTSYSQFIDKNNLHPFSIDMGAENAENLIITLTTLAEVGLAGLVQNQSLLIAEVIFFAENLSKADT